MLYAIVVVAQDRDRRRSYVNAFSHGRREMLGEKLLLFGSPGSMGAVSFAERQKREHGEEVSFLVLTEANPLGTSGVDLLKKLSSILEVQLLMKIVIDKDGENPDDLDVRFMAEPAQADLKRVLGELLMEFFKMADEANGA